MGAGASGGEAGGKEPEIIDIDDIPDMEEDDLEEGDEATAAPKAPVTVPSKNPARYLWLPVRISSLLIRCFQPFQA